MPTAKRKRAYHHGDLAPTLLDVAARSIVEVGVAELSLREVARRAGVSHAAPAHHFGDKAGLLTALATQGFERLAASIERAFEAEAAHDDKGRFLAAGVAYVRFAVENPAHFRVMWSPTLLHERNLDYLKAKARALDLLVRTVVRSHPGVLVGGRRPEELALAAWSAAHGLATLWLDGNLEPFKRGHGVAGLADRVLGLLNDAVGASR